MFQKKTLNKASGQYYLGLVIPEIAWYFTEKPYMDLMATSPKILGDVFYLLVGWEKIPG